jgi:hypothetical protein
MADSIADALGQVPLEVGIYHFQVGNLRVEVRVQEDSASTLPTPIHGSDVMLDPWVDLPDGGTMATLQASAGPPVLPDVPVVP